MDKLTPEQRRKCMQASKNKGTKPEVLLGKALWNLGLRYRKNDKNIFGKPDFSFKKYKVAIFVDGEFWHGKDWEIRKNDIKSNQEFWIAKIERNIERDREVAEMLLKSGWEILRFWGKDCKRIFSELINSLTFLIIAHELRFIYGQSITKNTQKLDV